MYSKHEWNDGELITKDLMNNMEKGIEDANNRAMTPGPQGEQGEDGQSAYELWKAQEGNSAKTEEDFLNSLKGVKGDKGETGEQGVKGDKGETGAKGADGKRGSIWTVGTVLTGEATDKVFSNSGLASSLIGDMYLNSTSFEVYKCTKDGNADTATWSKVGIIKGTDGADGETREAMTHIANATGSTDAHTVLNSLLAELIAKGYMAGA